MWLRFGRWWGGNSIRGLAPGKKDVRRGSFVNEEWSCGSLSGFCEEGIVVFDIILSFLELHYPGS